VQAKGIETAKPVIEALRRKGASAVGVAGFCWGCKWLPLNWCSLFPLVCEFCNTLSINCRM